MPALHDPHPCRILHVYIHEKFLDQPLPYTMVLHSCPHITYQVEVQRTPSTPPRLARHQHGEDTVDTPKPHAHRPHT